MRQLVKLDRQGLKKITTSSPVAVLHHGVTREKLVLCKYSSRLKLFKGVRVRRSSVFEAVSVKVKDTGCCLQEPAAKRRGLVNVCL